MSIPPAFAPHTNSGTVAQRVPVRVRRALMLVLNMVTILALLLAMWALLLPGGVIWGEWLMLAAYGLTLPWLSIGFWNSVAGFVLDRVYGQAAAAQVTPALLRADPDAPIRLRVAVVMPLRNEDPDASIARLRRLERDLARGPFAGRFAFHVLSDTDRPGIAQREQALMAEWTDQRPDTVILYRRRTDNAGYKAGNIAEFVHRFGEEYDLFLPLDADSEMGAQTVLRMVRVMQASPEIGMLQSLVTGLPSRTFFTRVFQFGMRHGMRSYTLGSAWWQADCGPNWGHNLLIRMIPFRDACMLPELPGRGPLSGHILSHDQVEAVLMRTTGLEVRVMAEESESREENPPSLVDFIRRELRWMNGNLQYLRLLGLPGLRPVSRLQLLLAIQMYVAAPAWMAFIVLGAAMAARQDQIEGVSVWAGLGLFALLMTLNLMPKIMGLAQVLAVPARAAAYGGRRRVVLGGLAEIVFSMLTTPVVAVALSIFLVGLCFGRRVGWDAQQRSRARLGWDEATRVLWPQTVMGTALALWLGFMAPWALPFAAPMMLALIGAIPLAVVATLPSVSRWSLNAGLFDIPEDRAALRPDDPADDPMVGLSPAATLAKE